MKEEEVILRIAQSFIFPDHCTKDTPNSLVLSTSLALVLELQTMNFDVQVTKHFGKPVDIFLMPFQAI
jgi:hypothetical protein